MPKSNSLEKPALVTDSTVLNMVRRSRNSMSSNQHQSIAQEEGNNTAASTACEKVICETRTKVSTSNNSNSVDGNIMKEEADTNCFQAVAISLCSSSALSRKGDCAFTRSCPALKPMQEDEIIKEVVENIVQNVLQETIKLSGVESKSDTVDAFANGSFVRHIPISKKYRIPKKSSATMSSDEDQMTRQQRTAASSQIQTNPYDSQPNRTSRLSIHHQVANKCASTSKDPVEHDLKGFPKPLRNSYEVGKQTTQTICNADISLGPHMINNSKPGVKVLLASTAISKLASSSECHLVENFQSHADEIACDSNSCNELMSNPDLPAVSFFSSNKELEESTKEHGNHLTTKPHIHSEKEFSENKGKDYSNLPSVSVSSLVSSKNRTASAYEVLTDELLDPQNSTSDFSLGSAEELTESPPFSPEHTVISYDRKRSAATQVIASGNIEQQKFCHEKVKNCSPTEGKLNHNLPQKNRTEPSSPDTKKCQQRSCHSRKPKKHQSVQGRGLIDGISSDVKQPFQTTPKGQSYDKCSSAEHLLCHTKKRSQSKDKHIENESQHRSVSKESQSSRGSLVQYRSHKTRKSSEHHSSEEKKYIKNDSLVSREKLVEHRSHGKTSAINQLRDYRNCKKQTSERFFLGSKASSSRLSHDSIKSQKSLLLSRRKTVDQRSPNESIYHESWSQNKWLDVKRKSHDERKFDRGHSRSSRSFLKDRYKTPAKQQSLSRLQHFENQAFATRKSPGGESYMMENQPRDKAFVEDITEGSRSSLKKFHRSRESQESELFHNGHSYEGERSSKSEARDKGQSLKSHLREIGHKDRPQKEGTTVQGQSQDGRTSLGHPSFDSCLISDHHARTKISRHQSEGYGEKVSAMDDASKTRNKLYEKHRYPSHLKEKLLRREGVYSEKKEDHGRLKNCSDHLLKERRGKRKLFDSGSDDGTKGVLKRCRRANPSHDKLLQEDLQSSRRISKECRRDYVTAPEQSNMKRPVVDSFAGRTESNISGCQQLESIEEFEKSTATSTVEGGLVLEEGELVSSDEERSKTPSEKSFQRSKSRGPHSKSPRSQSNSDKSKSTVVRSKYRTEESRRRP
ncbi:serine/arginine repetitive matrix protein 5-like [Watersipora subatra]|uniref:serine/arginine repetitive matrix protein 5-like n=1 Tax=Watersipora subatra TaxID=2589382 RepID=UPI00355AFB8A